MVRVLASQSLRGSGWRKNQWIMCVLPAKVRSHKSVSVTPPVAMETGFWS